MCSGKFRVCIDRLCCDVHYPAEIRGQGGEPKQMNSVTGFWPRLKNRLRFGLATQEILDRLARIGIVIYPYFLVEEPIVDRPELTTLHPNLQIRVLQPHEASLITGIPERPRQESVIRELMSRATCVVVMKKGELLAYSWFTRNDFRGIAGTNVLCELPPDWAYLFDMYVHPRARGRRMAVYIRHRVHQMLAEQGVAHCCSVSLMFNRSTRRFKAKLGAIETELRVLLRLKPFPGLDLRLRHKARQLETPAVHVAYPRAPLGL